MALKKFEKNHKVFDFEYVQSHSKSILNLKGALTIENKPDIISALEMSFCHSGTLVLNFQEVNVIDPSCRQLLNEMIGSFKNSRKKVVLAGLRPEGQDNNMSSLIFPVVGDYLNE